MNIDDPNNNRSSQRLLILVRGNGIDTLVGSGDDWRRSEIAVELPDSATAAKTLEEAVYAAPVLLADYTSVDVIADANSFVVVPAEIADDSECAAVVADRLWPDRHSDGLTLDRCGSAAFLTSFDKSLAGFVNRTFMRATLHNRLAVITSFFMSLSAPVNRVKLYAHFPSRSRVDIVALTSGGLLMANSFECDSQTDAVYFIMACVKDCGFDELDDEMLLCGDPEMCAAVTDTLRQYVNSVMPLLLPTTDFNVALELLSLKK